MSDLTDGLTDGLAALTQQRAKATTKRSGSARSIPAPRHPAKPVPATSPAMSPAAAPMADGVGEGGMPELEATPSTAAGSPPSSTSEGVDGAGAATPVPEVPLRRVTFYVDEAAHEWLEDIAFAGRRAKPRVDASRSAVVRLALERLMGEMGVDAVVAELQGRAQRAPDSPGRKRI